MRGRIYMVMRMLGGRSGGAERLFCEMANMFAESGYDVTCLTCEASAEPPFFDLSPSVTRLNLWGKAARRQPFYKVLDGLARFYRDHGFMAPADWLAKHLYFMRRLEVVFRTGKPDVVISFMPPANTVALLAGRVAGVKVIPTNHNVPEQDFESTERWDQNPIDRKLRLWSLYTAARVHVLAPSFVGWFPARLRPKVVALTNYVPPEFESYNPTTLRCKEILAVGRLAKVKNYSVLIAAWAKIAKQHPDWRVSIYGVGPLEGALQKQINKCGLSQSIFLRGHCANMLPVYASAEIFCHPALFEGFGLSPAEALACGLPVVAFADCAGTNEFVHDDVNGLMLDRASGADGLAAALSRLITDKVLRQRLRDAGPRSIEGLSFDAFRKRWVGLVEEVRNEGSERGVAGPNDGT